MQRRKFSREFKLEAVKLVRDRGVTMAQAARDLDLHINVLRKWVSDHGADPGGAFPGHGQMRPEQLEIERLRRENSVSRAVAFTPGSAARQARVPAATRCLAPGSAPASSPAIGHMVHGGSGTMCWPKASHAACIASSA